MQVDRVPTALLDRPAKEADVAGLRLLLVAQDAQDGAEALGRAGWAVELAADGHAGLRRGREGCFDVIVLDRRIPGLDGPAVPAALRQAGVATPVLLVTPLDSVAEAPEWADDFLVAPYTLRELEARVAALARRSVRPDPTPVILCVGDLTINRLTRGVRRGNREIVLLPLEFKLLEQLALNAGRITPRAMLLRQVWGFRFDPGTNIVETHVSRLRRKLDAPGAPSTIATVRGAGYVVGAFGAGGAPTRLNLGSSLARELQVAG